MTSTGREHTTFVRQFQQTAVSTFSGQSSYTVFYTFLSVAVISFSQQTWQVRRLGCKKTWGHRPVSVISGTQVIMATLLLWKNICAWQRIQCPTDWKIQHIKGADQRGGIKGFKPPNPELVQCHTIVYIYIVWDHTYTMVTQAATVIVHFFDSLCIVHI